jgi:hypothetical protein
MTTKSASSALATSISSAPEHVSYWSVALICMYSGVATAQSSHCTHAERVMFSCQLIRSKKIVSLCASPNISHSSGYIQYRFGGVHHAELVYPSDRTHPRGNFDLFHIQFTRASAYGISYKLEGYEYTLRYLASGPDPRDDEYQLIVAAANSEETKFVDVCDKAHIVGKTIFYPMEVLSKRLGIEILEKAHDN